MISAFLHSVGYTDTKLAAFALFVGIGFFGMIVHWGKRWLRDQSKSGIISYFFREHVKYTIMSVLTYFGAIGGMVAMGTTDFANPQALALSFMAGYMVDSAVNKDEAQP